MSDDELTPDEAAARLETAIEDWWRSDFATQGASVVRSWYLVAVGKAWDDDGDPVAHIGQRWEGDVIDQLGLAQYVTRAVQRRLGDADDD